GKVLATAVDHSYGDEVRLWDLATNQVLHELKSRARSLAFSADSKKLAIAECSDSTAKVWDVETGKELATFGKSPDQVLAVAFSPSPEGRPRAAAKAGKDPNVKLWDVATGEERFTLKGPTCLLQSLAFSPDGNVLAVAGEDDRKGKTTASVVRLWDPATGKQIADLNMQGDRTHWPTSLGFSRSGILVTASDAAVRIWEMEKKKQAPCSTFQPLPAGVVLLAGSGSRFAAELVISSRPVRKLMS